MRMEINYKNVDLDIYVNCKKIDYDINKDIDIDFVRDSFNGAVGELSVKHHSLDYWLMRLSERNTLVNNLFLDICKILLIESIIYKYKEVSVYTNNVSVYLYFKDSARISFKSKFLFILKKLSSEYKPYLQVLKFIYYQVIFHIKYADKQFVKCLTGSIIIQTWVSDSNFKNDDFKDTYYFDLTKYLKHNDKKVFTWPIFYNVKYKKKAVEFLRQKSTQFLLLEDYLRFSDYFVVCKSFFNKRLLKLGSINIIKSDVSTIFKFYQKKESVEYVSLFYQFTKRLAFLDNQSIKFIQNHENMISEKSLILGVRKYLKNSKVMGYFHTTKPKNILCLDFANEKEYKIAPKPDSIIFNSEKYLHIFKYKYSNIPMHNGIAFKQLHLKNTHLKNATKTDSVLVLFSGTNDEIELMFSLLKNVSTENNFLFRMHPMNQFDVSKYSPMKNYSIVNDQSLDVSLSKVKKIISTYSAVALESALKGLTVGLIYNKKKLILNPFDHTGISNYRLISNSDQLEVFLNSSFVCVEVEQIFNLDDKYYEIFLNI